MLLSELRLENFKNYDRVFLEELTSLVCFTGKNGAGKTNLLDAIHVLCTGRSYFQRVEQNLMLNRCPFYAIHGKLEDQVKNYEVHIAQAQGRRKQINLNGEIIRRVTDYYGSFGVVMIAPGDVSIILGAGEERRSWMDSVISLVDKEYLLALLQYDKLLKQRNALLRQLSESGSNDHSLLSVYDEQIWPVAQAIHNGRVDFITSFQPWFTDAYQIMAGESELAIITYISQMNHEGIEALYQNHLKKDIVIQRTSTGPHRDSLGMAIHADVKDLKTFGSQGQQKTFLIALKMAQFRFIQDKLKQSPIMLLDDICERLDEVRLGKLFDMLASSHAGQVFITDTNVDMLKRTMPILMGKASFYTVANGTVSKQD